VVSEADGEDRGSRGGVGAETFEPLHDLRRDSAVVGIVEDVVSSGAHAHDLAARQGGRQRACRRDGRDDVRVTVHEQHRHLDVARLETIKNVQDLHGYATGERTPDERGVAAEAGPVHRTCGPSVQLVRPFRGAPVGGSGESAGQQQTVEREGSAGRDGERPGRAGIGTGEHERGGRVGVQLGERLTGDADRDRIVERPDRVPVKGQALAESLVDAGVFTATRQEQDRAPDRDALGRIPGATGRRPGEHGRRDAGGIRGQGHRDAPAVIRSPDVADAAFADSAVTAAVSRRASSVRTRGSR
jgi:hypothetical protein